MAAGYSGTPLALKLGIKDHATVVLLSAPSGFENPLEALPPTAKVTRRAPAGPTADVVVAFFRAAADLHRDFAKLKGMLSCSGGLWIAWPKRASGVATDITEDTVRGVALAGGLVDNKVCAIDETWSGLRLVYRLADRKVHLTPPATRLAKKVRSKAAKRPK